MPLFKGFIKLTEVKWMRVKMKTSLSGLNFSYKKGEEIELEKDRGEEWVKAGVAEELANKKPIKKPKSKETVEK